MITKDALIEATRQVAATEPDRIYDNLDGVGPCQYAPNTANPCGCLIGEALALLGVPLERLIALDNVRTDEVGWATPALARALSDLVHSEALYSQWVCQVQRAQDAGKTWAQAVIVADKSLARTR